MNKENLNLAPKQKQVWKKPDFYILDSGNINGGTHVNVHERSVVSSHKVVNPTSSGGPGFSTSYRFHHGGTPKTYTGRAHPKSFYNS
ncbi:MAG: hypothetical protein V4553_11145 [Bacteroidota bacterium]